jgi:transposase
METRTVSSFPTAAPHQDAVRCLLAIELSKASWVVAIHTPLSDKISRYTLEGSNGNASLN